LAEPKGERDFSTEDVLPADGLLPNCRQLSDVYPLTGIQLKIKNVFKWIKN